MQMWSAVVGLCGVALATVGGLVDVVELDRRGFGEAKYFFESGAGSER